MVKVALIQGRISENSDPINICFIADIVSYFRDHFQITINESDNDNNPAFEMSEFDKVY